VADTAEWRWLPAGLEAAASDLRSGEARLEIDSGRAPQIPLPNPRVSRSGNDVRWAFDDLQFGPPMTADGITRVVVSAAGKDVAELPLGRAYDVVEGYFTVVCGPDAVLTIRGRN
jgi:hypothetical protein